MLGECLTESKRLWPESSHFLQTECQGNQLVVYNIVGFFYY
jgi:hypothetical protein